MICWLHDAHITLIDDCFSLDSQFLLFHFFLISVRFFFSSVEFILQSICAFKCAHKLNHIHTKLSVQIAQVKQLVKMNEKWGEMDKTLRVNKKRKHKNPVICYNNTWMLYVYIIQAMYRYSLANHTKTICEKNLCMTSSIPLKTHLVHIIKYYIDYSCSYIVAYIVYNLVCYY